MGLLEYIDSMDRRRILALAVDSNPDYLWRVATNRRKASYRLARRIEVETAGLVTKYSLRPDIFDPPPDAPVAESAATAAVADSDSTGDIHRTSEEGFC